MGASVSRRSFLKVAGLSLCGLAFRPPPPPQGSEPISLGRVTVQRIGLYREPSFRSTLLTSLHRDELLPILARERADEGPPHNPVWYRVPDGYVHSGRVQTVRWEPQAPLIRIPDGGALFEVSVPYSRSYRAPDPTSNPLYRLYYGSTAWVEESVVGADGRRWYQLLDDLLRFRYFVRAEHLRWIPPHELTPLSPEVPLSAKRVEVSLPRQELLAYEFDRLVFRTTIASGIPDPRPRANGVPTATPTGWFHIDKKTPLRHMGNGRLTADLTAYELPGVPWVSFFHETGVAFHGTYWHDDFGRPQSHGCINMRTEEARWLYRWTLPSVQPHEILRIGRGTPVWVM